MESFDELEGQENNLINLDLIEESINRALLFDDNKNELRYNNKLIVFCMFFLITAIAVFLVLFFLKYKY